MKAILVDIDGTLSNLEHRMHYITQTNPKDWDAFFAGVFYDAPNHSLIQMVQALSRDFFIILCSGRPEKCRVDTELWLDKHFIPFNFMLMRKDDDRREDYIVKEEFLEQLQNYTIIAAIDDRQQVVDMWRRNGILCLQCAPGQF